ncbi:TPA: DUF2591 family protein [Serratia marcescens]|nr:DUF2591 family protein [Serratia marcescens]
MTDYSKMSDLDINVLVGEIQGFANKIAALNGMRDYCNNPADAWPIIAENKINIDFRDSLKAGPMAKLCRDNGIYAVDKNPLRAAMIVFLMMKDAEKC